MDLRRGALLDLERHWAEEVRHLHSLWHQGPPRNDNSLNPNPSLPPAASAVFKNKSKEKKKKKQKVDRPAAGIEWPCPPSPAPQPVDATWPVAAPPPPADVLPAPTAEEQARAFAARVQNKALRDCEGFFSKKDGSEDEEEEDDDDEDSMDDEEGKVGTFEFFLGLFEKDGDLREYYEKHSEKGEFSCLACTGNGLKRKKKFGNCVALVQHSNSVTKTKRREAHRAFARAVCRVLGWDINRLPSIVLDMGDSLGKTLAKLSSQEEDMQKEDPSEQNENLSDKKQGIPQETAGNMGISSNDLSGSVGRNIEALPSEYVQNGGEIDVNENNDDITDCLEVKETDKLLNELPAGDCCVDSNDGTIMGNSLDSKVTEIAG